MFDKLKELWVKYCDWLMGLPDFIGFVLGLVTVSTPIFVLAIGLIGVLDFHLKWECLDSQWERRWSPTDRICEEYHDGEWIEADLSGDNIYYYNDAASREH